jgi:hypothetical protein
MELLRDERKRLIDSHLPSPQDIENYCAAVRNIADMIMGREDEESVGAMNEPGAISALGVLRNELEGIKHNLPAQSDEVVLAEKYIYDITRRVEGAVNAKRTIDREREAIRRRAGGFTAGTTRA